LLQAFQAFAKALRTLLIGRSHQRERGKQTAFLKYLKQFSISIFHFPFSIFHFPFSIYSPPPSPLTQGAGKEFSEALEKGIGICYNLY